MKEEQSEYGERASLSAGVDKRTSRVAAYHRLVICVSLRMAASAEAPLSPMLLPRDTASEGQDERRE